MFFFSPIKLKKKKKEEAHLGGVCVGGCKEGGGEGGGGGGGAVMTGVYHWVKMSNGVVHVRCIFPPKACNKFGG